MTTRCTVLVLAMATLATIACTAQARSPESVPIDRVECARCRMLISSERGTGELVSVIDDTRFYDDVACLAADWAQHGSGSSAFVRLATGAWSNAHTAWYARPAGARTAMGSGFVAFATEAEARAADAANRALRFDAILQQAGDAR